METAEFRKTNSVSPLRQRMIEFSNPNARRNKALARRYGLSDALPPSRTPMTE